MIAPSPSSSSNKIYFLIVLQTYKQCDQYNLGGGEGDEVYPAVGVPNEAAHHNNGSNFGGEGVYPAVGVPNEAASLFPFNKMGG